MSEWNAETAEWYAHKYGEHATNRLAVDALDLTPLAVIVDVGCGTGSALRHAATRVPRGTFIGIDPIPRMLEIARERAAAHPGGARIDFREGSAEALPVGDDVADLVLAFDSFDHWQDTRLGLAEVWRVLEAGGRLVVVRDDAVPGGSGARRAFREALARAGFAECSKRSIAADGVAFTMWVCGVAD